MKHKRGKQILPIQKKLKKNIRAALIPHAEATFAGHARHAALRYFKKTTKYIIYLATLHHINSSNKTYILHKDKGFHLGTPHNFVYTKKREHSFDWVYHELIGLFPSAKILALAPNSGVTDLHLWIIHFLKTHKDCIFIGTVDLIHYGKSFHNLSYLSYPQQMNKMVKEEQLIKSLINPDINLKHIKNVITTDKKIVDGSKTLVIFMQIMKAMGYIGRVADYYDSHGSQSDDLVSRYTIGIQPVHSLVSYVSIIYSIKDIEDLLPIDILLALGLIKGIITRNIHHKNYPLRLPNWSPLNKKTSGIFVGTSLGNQTNCSYGQYEHNKSLKKISSAEKIIHASQNCIRNAKHHWKIPYTPDNINQLSYKIEFLDPVDKWISYPGYMIPKKFNKNGKYGIYLQLPNGGAATYLPVVFRDSKHLSIQKLMQMLTKKAGGRGNMWKKGQAKIYKTISYTWNPYTKSIDVYPPPLLLKRGSSKRNTIRKKYHKKRKKTRKKK